MAGAHSLSGQNLEGPHDITGPLVTAGQWCTRAVLGEEQRRETECADTTCLVEVGSSCLPSRLAAHGHHEVVDPYGIALQEVRKRELVGQVAVLRIEGVLQRCVVKKRAS